MEILIVTGPPNSGISTQCEILSKETSFKHISIDDRCRLEEENSTELGLLIFGYQARGKMVPDWVMKAVFDRVIEESRSEAGIILDGFPRTIDQIKDLIKSVGLKKQKIINVINLEVNKDELLNRLFNKADVSSEMDNKNLIIQLKRLSDYEAYTKPAIQFLKYKFNVLSINGIGNVNEIAKNIKGGVKIYDRTEN